MNLLEKIEHSRSLIAKALSKFKTVVAVSWGKDSMATLHLALQVDKNIPCFTVITDKKPRETIEYMERMRQEWRLNLKVYKSDVKVPDNLPYTDPDECCRILKVEPTLKAIKGYECWITGLRNTEGRTRTDYQEVEVYEDIVKVNPILIWTEREVWQYLATNCIPVHPWYAKGYRSLGCVPCTAIVDEYEFERAGRWKGTSKCGGECGIHTYHKLRKK
jgi:phosphoadenosine phosphosulfate reductase